jgi:uncharacterized RDD family membrane protein YckC
VTLAPDLDAGAANAESLLGHYAGSVTRFCAFIVDGVIAVGLFNLGVAALAWVVHLFTGYDLPVAHGGPWWLVPLAVWLFIYNWYCDTLAGKTPGKALFGLRIVRGDGSDLDGGHAALRVAAFPLSFLLLGVGFVGIVLGRRHRALHDVVADTAVVYDFDARAAHFRLTARHRRSVSDANSPPRPA